MGHSGSLSVSRWLIWVPNLVSFWARFGMQILKNGAITIFTFFLSYSFTNSTNYATLFVSRTHAFTFTHTHAVVAVIYFENVTSFLLLWRNGILTSIQADISTLNATCSLFKVCVCARACFQTESVCWWICVFFARCKQNPFSDVFQFPQVWHREKERSGSQRLDIIFFHPPYIILSQEEVDLLHASV